MFDIYQQVAQALGYSQVFTATDDIWDNCSIDELSGIIAQTDSETDLPGFFDECDRIDCTIRSLGYDF